MNWDSAIGEIGPRIYRFFCGQFPSETAADLTQEVMIRMVQKYDRGEYNSKQGSLIMFAFGIAKLVRLEAFRTQPAQAFANAHDLEDVLPAADVTEDPRLIHFRRCIDELTETQRQIVLLLIDEELSLVEIAQLTALPLNTVKSHIYRAKETLRKLMTNEGVENG